MATDRTNARTYGPLFTCTRTEIKLVSQIAHRAVLLAQRAGVDYDHVDAMMDLEAAHSNGCPLDFEALLAADDSNFLHDVFGIRRHLDRMTGKLGGCFAPRYAQRHADGAAVSLHSVARS